VSGGNDAKPVEGIATISTYREYSGALWVSAVFVLVSVFDGFLKIPLINGPLIYFGFFDIAKLICIDRFGPF
jgi:hypothetical protein